MHHRGGSGDPGDRQEPVDEAMAARIRAEGLEHSKVLDIFIYL